MNLCYEIDKFSRKLQKAGYSVKGYAKGSEDDYAKIKWKIRKVRGGK